LHAVEGVWKFEKRIARGVVDLALERFIRGVVGVRDREDGGWLNSLRHSCEARSTPPARPDEERQLAMPVTRRYALYTAQGEEGVRRGQGGRKRK